MEGLDFLFGESGPFTQRSLVWLGGWSVWMQVLVGVLALGVVGLTLWNYRQLRPLGRRALMVGLRLTIVVVLVGVFYQPAFLEENVTKSRNHIAVLVDTSESMGLPHGDQTRIGYVRRFLQANQGLWERLREEGELSFLSFGEHLGELPEPGQARAGTALLTNGRSTRLIEALHDLKRRFRNRDLGGVLVLTDGIDTTAAGQRARLDAATQAVVRDLDAPIVAFVPPTGVPVQDVEIAHLAYNNFAFLLNATSLEATVRVHGFDGPAARGQLVVRLSENGQEVDRRFVALVPGQRDYPVAFEYVPRELGKQVYGVSVDPVPGELYVPNNAQQAIVNVIRDKIRVLQIVGQPSWDERFLRNHLKQDPNVDLISFFILVNQNNYRPLMEHETSLIPFPAKELFEDELGGFDLAIFQNFNYGPFRTRQYLPHIAQYVRDGGAFVMIGGPLSFSAGGYYGTPITDVLPVDIPPGFETTTDTRPYRARLSEAGRTHPVTRLAQDPAANQAVWGELEDLEGANMVTRAKPDAMVLAEHPTLRDATGKPMPLVTVREVGKGRSMAVTTDSLWHWSFKAGNGGKDPRHFDAFWSSAIKWLIKDPALELVRVRVLRERVPVGEAAQARIEVFLTDYRPAADHRVDVVVRRRDAGDRPGQGAEVLRLSDQRTDGAGQLEVDLPLDAAGIYEVEASATVAQGRVTRGRDLFVATELNPELETIVSDGRLLDQLAEASGGEVRSLDEVDPALTLREPRIQKVASRRHRELWNTPFIVLVLALLFGAEWWLRRRFGYL